MLRLIFLFLTVSCATGLAARDIVVFLADDLGRLDIAPYGCREIRTPNMQKLADSGMTFDRAYVASPSCAPSRAALLTGMMPARNGAEANHSKPREDIKKWPAYFRELGYEVASFGKVAHYQHTKLYGFDVFANDKFHDHAGITAAVEFLKNRPRDGSRPLCIMIGSNWPHVPWPEKSSIAPASLTLPAGSVDTPETREWRARYAEAVENADRDLGVVLAAVKAHLAPDTIMLFSSDHGAQWPFGKWNLYESGVAVPLMVACPGVAKPGSRTDAMVQWTDFLPTLVELAGGKAPEGIDGRSFASVIKGNESTHRPVIFTTHSADNRMNVYPMRALRDENWKYIRNLHPEYAFTTHIDLVGGKLGQRAFFGTWEQAAKSDAGATSILKRYHERPAEELYDLSSDPTEQRNLASAPEHAEKLRSLRVRLDEWIATQNDKLTTFGEPRLLANPKSFGPDAAQ